MKYTILIVIVILVAGCRPNKDIFWNTSGVFETEEDVYFVEDDFLIKVIISSEENATVRFYENFSNLEIRFSLLVPCESDSTLDCIDFLGDLYNIRETSDIIDYSIKPGKPFIKEVLCKVEKDENQIAISIPELEYVAHIDENVFENKTIIRIHGHCRPIDASNFDSLEDYIETKEIEIRINKR